MRRKLAFFRVQICAFVQSIKHVDCIEIMQHFLKTNIPKNICVCKWPTNLILNCLILPSIKMQSNKIWICIWNVLLHLNLLVMFECRFNHLNTTYDGAIAFFLHFHNSYTGTTWTSQNQLSSINCVHGRWVKIQIEKNAHCSMKRKAHRKCFWMQEKFRWFMWKFQQTRTMANYVDEVIKMYLVVKLCKMKHRLWSFNYS